jgi:hypothetical protein
MSDLQFWEDLPREIGLKIMAYLIVPTQITDLKDRLRRAQMKYTGGEDSSDSECRRGLRRSKRLRRMNTRVDDSDSDSDPMYDDVGFPGINQPGNLSIEPTENLLKLWFPGYNQIDSDLPLHDVPVHGPWFNGQAKWGGQPYPSSRKADYKIVENLITVSQVSQTLRSLANDKIIWRRANEWLYHGKQTWNTAGPLVPHGLCSFNGENAHLLLQMNWEELEGLVEARVRCGMLDGYSLYHLDEDDAIKHFDVSKFHSLRMRIEETQTEMGLDDDSALTAEITRWTQRLERIVRLIQVSEPHWLDPFMGEAPKFHSIFKYSFATAMMDGLRNFITSHEMTTNDFGLAFFHHRQWSMGQRDRIVCRFGRDGRYRSPWIRDDDEESIPLTEERRPSAPHAGLHWSLNGDSEGELYFTEYGRPSADPLPRLPSEAMLEPPDLPPLEQAGNLDIVLPPNQRMGLHQFATKGLISSSVVGIQRKSTLHARYRKTSMRIGPYPPLRVVRGHDWSWRGSNGVAIMSTISQIGRSAVVWRDPWWLNDDDEEGEIVESD